MFVVECVEHLDLVDAVDELGAEALARLAHHRLLDQVLVLPGQALDLVRAEVRGHHQHGVLEVQRAALAVGHAAIVERVRPHRATRAILSVANSSARSTRSTACAAILDPIARARQRQRKRQ